MSDSVLRNPTERVPEPVAEIAKLMSPFPAPWALCGGWAVDAWLGRQSRDHGDVDIAVFIQDQRALFEHLPGWQLLAHDPVFDPSAPGKNGEWWDGRRRLSHPSHIHARPPELSGPIPKGGLAWAKDGFTLEFQLDDRSDDEWVLSHDPHISLPLRSCVQQSPWGLPTAVPEVLLFFKATAYFGIEEQMTGGRYQDEPDFLALLPHLTEKQRRWLREAISLVRPEHPWLSRLAPQPSTDHRVVGQSS